MKQSYNKRDHGPFHVASPKKNFGTQKNFILEKITN